MNRRSSLRRREDRFIQKARQGGRMVAAFSSGHIIRMIAARWLALQPIEAKCFYCDTASINILGYEHNATEPVVRLWNEKGKG